VVAPTAASKNGVDVFLHRAWRERQRVGDGGIRFALRHARQNVSLTRSELGNWRLRDTSSLCDQPLDHPRVNDGATLGNFANRGHG